uniref:DUF4283 domain-containing protein n=1 Tax=Cannabis sativa TaxID=3483 RepID=A0A803Q5K5_CANSA
MGDSNQNIEEMNVENVAGGVDGEFMEGVGVDLSTPNGPDKETLTSSSNTHNNGRPGAGFEINGELIRFGVLVCFFDGNGLLRMKLKEILGNIWKQGIKGQWRFKTLKPGMLGIFFDLEEDCIEILHRRPWIINGKLLIIREWLEDANWTVVDMKKTVFWAQATGLPTPYLNRSNISIIAAKVGTFMNSDTWDQRTISRR